MQKSLLLIFIMMSVLQCGQEFQQFENSFNVQGVYDPETQTLTDFHRKKVYKIIEITDVEQLQTGQTEVDQTQKTPAQCICDNEPRLTLFAGLMSGLTVGYLSIDNLFLQIKLSTGNEKEIRAAKRVLPILQQHHFLLVTLLLANAAAMEALPIFLDALVPSYIAVIISVTAVLFFGQIIPQAVCTGPNQIQIAASIAPGTKCLMYLLSPISYPISLFLDLCLGKYHKQRFGNQDLKALIHLHSSKIMSEQKIGLEQGLDQFQSNIIERAIQLKQERADNTMVEYEDVFKVSDNQIISSHLVNILIKSKQQSVPIFTGNNPNLVIGTIQTEILIELSRKDESFDNNNNSQKLEHYFRQFKEPLVIQPGTSLLNAFKMMKTRKAHFCIITNEAEQLLAAISDYYYNKKSMKCSDDSEKKSTTATQSSNGWDDSSFNESSQINGFERERSMSQSLHLNYLLGEDQKLISILGIVTLESVIQKLFTQKQQINQISINQTVQSSQQSRKILSSNKFSASFIHENKKELNKLLSKDKKPNQADEVSNQPFPVVNGRKGQIMMTQMKQHLLFNPFEHEQKNNSALFTRKGAIPDFNSLQPHPIDFQDNGDGEDKKKNFHEK